MESQFRPGGVDPCTILAILTSLQNKREEIPARPEKTTQPTKQRKRAREEKTDDPVDSLEELAESGCKHLSEFRTVAAKISKNVGQYNLEKLTVALQSYIRGIMLDSSEGGAAITTLDTDFCRFICKEMKSQLSNLSCLEACQLTTIVSSLDKVGFRDNELLGAIGREILQKQKSFREKDWSVVVRAFTRAGLPLKGDCTPIKRAKFVRDWERPPPPKRPKPISEC
eukprot:GHVN01067573.1.p1 GENE.GHVN01067573.1~~GHVN01067573.1.p1  ORF type:complete len:226 (+),score=31.27 GHVN01067573.1:43-720(+)